MSESMPLVGELAEIVLPNVGLVVTREESRRLGDDRVLERLRTADVIVPSPPPSAVARIERELPSVVDAIRTYGQLVPIIVNEDGLVLDGVIRVLALQSLGWPLVSVQRVLNTNLADDIDVRLIANSVRSDIGLSEAADLWKKSMALLASVTRAKVGEVTARSNIMRGSDPSLAKLAELGISAPSEPMRARELALQGLPFGYETLRKVERLRAASSDEELPSAVREVAQRGVEEIERTGKVDGAYRRLVAAETLKSEPDTADYDDAAFNGELARRLKAASVLLRMDPERARDLLAKRGLYAGFRVTVTHLVEWGQSFMAHDETGK